MNYPQKENQKTTTTMTTTTTAALTLAAFAFLGVAAISAISMLSPIQQATAQESTPTCVKVLNGHLGEVGEPPQNGGPPEVVHLFPGETPIGEILPNKACAELR